jgi:hypothetical protein
MEASFIHTRATIQANTDAAGVLVLKKAIEVDVEPIVPSSSDNKSYFPSHLGQNIDTLA